MPQPPMVIFSEKYEQSRPVYHIVSNATMSNHINSTQNQTYPRFHLQIASTNNATLQQKQPTRENHTENVLGLFRYATQDKHLKQYIMSKTAWNYEIFDEIAWDDLGTALRPITGKRRKAYIKLTHALWATNERQAQQTKRRHDNRCPRCNRPREDFTHVFRCKRETNKETVRGAIADLRTHLIERHDTSHHSRNHDMDKR